MMQNYSKFKTDCISINNTKDCSPIIASPTHLELKPEYLENLDCLLNILRQSKDIVAKTIIGSETQTNFKQRYTTGNIVKEIIKMYAKEGKLQSLLITILGKLVNEGNKNEFWSICPVVFPVNIKPAKNTVSKALALELSISKLWCDHADNKMKSKDFFKNLTKEEKIGSLLLYATKKGGLLNKSSLYTLLQELENPIILYQTRYVFPLSIKDSEGNTEQYQRWEPDISTLLLMTRLSTSEKKYAKSIKKNELIKPIKAFLTSLKLEASELPDILSSFIQIMSTKYNQIIPPYLVHYAKRGVISHAHHDKSFYRKKGDNRKVKEIKEVELTEITDEALGSNEETLDCSDIFSCQWLQSLKNCLKDNTKEEAIIKLQAFIKNDKTTSLTHDTLSIRTYLSKWTLYMLEKGSAANRKLELSTIRTYLSTISQKILIAFGSFNPIEMTEDLYDEVYLELLSLNISTSNRNSLCKLLYAFHMFLVKKYDVVKISTGGVLGIKERLSPVDANIVSIDEYYELLAWLNDESDLFQRSPEVLQATRIIVIIGYRLGLRRSEALKLRIIDIEGIIDTVLKVRAFEGKTIKSIRSKRNFNIDWYLEDDEIAELQNWVKKRNDDEKSCSFSQYLFAIPSLNILFLTENIIIPVIHKGLRYVTGDSSLRFHHFRHSFCSWNILRLALDSLNIPINNYITDQPLTNSWLSKAKDFRMKAFSRTDLYQRDFYLISGQLGHSTTDLSAEHYFHFYDNILKLAIDSTFINDDKPLITNLSGLKKTKAYNYLKPTSKDGIDYSNIIKEVHKNSIEKGNNIFVDYNDIYENELSKKEYELKEPPSIAVLTFTNIAHMLSYYFKHKPSFEYLQDRFAFTQRQVKSLEKSSYQLFNQATVAKDQISRARKAKNIIWRKGVQENHELNVLQEPKDKNNVSIFINNLWEGLQVHPKITKWLIINIVHKSWRTENKLAFLLPKRADKFIENLILLNFSNIDISLRYGTEQQPKKCIGLWKTQSPQLKKHRVKIKLIKGTNKKHGAQGEIRVGLLNDKKHHASDALRYVAGLFYIYIKSNLSKY